MSEHTPGPWTMEPIGIGTARVWVPEADARLIADAPDLLSALKALLADSMHVESAEKTRQVEEMAEAAIAKAEGR